MPKRELSKCREWERERRERLKTCFDALARLLPSHDPTITPSKLEILQRSAAHITDLQQKNKELLLGDQKLTGVAQRDEVRRLRDRVKKLSARGEQLANLLKSAGLKIPKECIGAFKGPPRLWSGRLTRERAEILRKQHENVTKTSRKRKSPKKPLNCSENTDPLAPPLKKPRLTLKPTSSTPKKTSKKQQTPGGLSTSSSASLASKVATVLGPGTLILANGSVVPVPAPVGGPTLHRIQIVPAQSNPVILMPKNVCTKNTTSSTNTITSKLPVLRPKSSANSRQGVSTAKIAIPPLPKKKICGKKPKNTAVCANSAKSSTSSTADTANNVDKSAKNNNTETSAKSSENSTEKHRKNVKKKLKNEKKNVQNIVNSENINKDSLKNNETSKKSDQIDQKINLDTSQTIQNTSRKSVLSLKVSEITTKETESNIPQNDAKSEKPNSKHSNEHKTDPKCQNYNNLQPQNEQNTLLHIQTDPVDPQLTSSAPQLTSSEPQLTSSEPQSTSSEPQFISTIPQLTPSDPPPHEVIQNLQDDHELSNDIFASLGGPTDSAGVIGGQHTESMSPTAAFLLAFPLVSTLTGSRMTDPQNGISGGNHNNNGGNNHNNDRNNSEDDRQSTPTTLLQIGGTMNLDNDKIHSRTVQIEDSITIEHSRSSKTLLQIGNMDLDGSKNNSRSVLQLENIDNNKNLHQINNTLSLEHSRSSKTILEIGNMNLDSSKNNPRSVHQMGNIDNNKNMHQINDTISLEHSRTPKTLLQIGNMDLDTNKHNSRSIHQIGNIDNKNMQQIDDTISLEHSRTPKTLLQIGNMDLDTNKNNSRSIHQMGNIDNNKTMQRIDDAISLEHSRTSKTLLEIGNMDLGGSKNNSRAILYNIDSKNLQQINETLSLEHSRTSKTLLEIGNIDLDTNKNNSRSVHQLGNIDNNKNMQQINQTVTLEHSRSSKNLLQIGNIDLDSNKNNFRSVHQMGNIDNNKNMQQINQTVSLEHSRSSKNLLQLGNIDLDTNKNNSRPVHQMGNIDNKNMEQINQTVALEHSRSSKNLLQIGNMDLDSNKNNSRPVHQMGNIDNNKNMQQINQTVSLEHSRSSKNLLQIGNMDLDNNKNNSRPVHQMGNIDNNKNMQQINQTVALEHSRSSKNLLQIGNMDLDSNKNNARPVHQMGNIDNNKNMQQINQTVSLEHSRSSKNLLQIGNMDLDNNKNNSRTVLSIGNIDNSKNLQQIDESITLEHSRNSKNELQQMENSLKHRTDLSRSVDTFGFFRDSQNYNNTQINSTNSYLNPNNRENGSCVENSNKDSLISSVLQVSHACLYEQRNQHQNSNFYAPFPEIRSDNCQMNPQNTYCQPKDKNSTKNRSKQQNQRPPVNWMTTPDIRSTYSTNEHQTTPTTSGMTSDYFLPPFSDVYSGISSAISSENNDFSWAATNRNVLPTLLGDLALGVTSSINTTNSVIYTNTATKTVSNNQYYPFDPTQTISSHHTHQIPQIQAGPMPQTPQNGPQNQSGSQHQNKDSFLSVSSILVGQKSRKGQNNSKRNRDKSKSRSSTHISDPNVSFEGHKKYGGGYSAEELIADTSNANISSYSIPNLQNLNNLPSDPSPQQSYHRAQTLPQNGGPQIQNNPQTHQQTSQTSSRQNQAYNLQPNRQQAQHQQQGPFGGTYPALPTNHGEFSALLSAAVVDTYSKTFDSFVHVKPPAVPPNGGPGGPTPAGGFDSYCTTSRIDTSHGHHRAHNSGAPESDRRRHSRRSGAPTTSRDSLVTNVANTTHTNTAAGFSELSFLTMSGAVGSPILPDDFHASAPFITSAPPPIPTPVASSLTNFNLSAIFPEINKGATVSSAPSAPVWPHSKPPVSTSRSQTRYQHQNQTVHQHSTLPGGGKPPGGYCHPQQHTHSQQLPHEGLYGSGAPSQSFPGILGHQVQTGSNTDVTAAPTNFSFSFAAP